MNQETQENGNGSRHKAVAIAPARLPYHPALEERFGVGQAEWRALVDAIFPLAKEAESIILALSYCRARKLDPFKRVVHIVPMWNVQLGRMVETVWPGIGELRTTAFRTRQYAGRDNAEFGPTVTRQIGGATIEFPEWCQITAYRVLDGQKYPFPGPRVYWMECYATTKKDDATPNSMWRKRPFGQIDKCAEAAALRAAFPEEIGNDHIAEEMDGKTLGVEPSKIATATTQKRTLAEKLDALADGGNGNGDPPHDPDTGEIIATRPPIYPSEWADKPNDAAEPPNMQNDPTGEEAARQLAAKLEERAVATSETTQKRVESETADAADAGLQRLLDEGRATATNGTAKFKRWEARLSAPDFERIKPHLAALQEGAAAADAARE